MTNQPTMIPRSFRAANVEKRNVHEELIVTLSQLVNAAECDALLARAEERGWNQSPPSGGGHGRTGTEDARTNKFCVLHDATIADELWTRVRRYLPPDLTHIPYNTYLNSSTRGAEWKPVGVVDKLRFYKYEVGDEFPEHVDYKSGRDVVRLVDGTFEV